MGYRQGKDFGNMAQRIANNDAGAIYRMARNRFKSEVNHTDRPSKWIRNVTMFASGPIDRFGKPLSLKNMNGGHHAAVPSGTGNQIVGVLERTLAGRQRNRALSEDGD